MQAQRPLHRVNTQGELSEKVLLAGMQGYYDCSAKFVKGISRCNLNESRTIQPRIPVSQMYPPPESSHCYRECSSGITYSPFLVKEGLRGTLTTMRKVGEWTCVNFRLIRLGAVYDDYGPAATYLLILISNSRRPAQLTYRDRESRSLNYLKSDLIGRNLLGPW